MPHLKGDYIYLRNFELEDITDEYLSWLSDPVLMRYSNQRFREHNRETAKEYMDVARSGENLFCAVVGIETGEVVGSIAARVDTTHSTADIGIMLGKREARGKGVGLAAWTLVESHLFDSLRLRKITAGTLRLNQPMINLALASGMHLEGVRRNQELVEGSAVDMLLFAKFNDG